MQLTNCIKCIKLNVLQLLVLTHPYNYDIKNINKNTYGKAVKGFSVKKYNQC